MLPETPKWGWGEVGVGVFLQRGRGSDTEQPRTGHMFPFSFQTGDYQDKLDEMYIAN